MVPFIERQRHGGHDYYYLARSVRTSPTEVRKVRLFLGREVPPRSKLPELFRELERKTPRRYAPRLLSAETVERLDDLQAGIASLGRAPSEVPPKDFPVRFTYNSNAIEGNPLTLRQTALLLVDGVTPAGIRTEHAMEALNSKDAWEYVRAFKGPLNRACLCKVQYRLSKHTSCRLQGTYRDRDVRIDGSSWVPPPASRVPEEMERVFHRFRAERTTTHPVERAALLHNRVARVHPFTDGNGRVARLLLNWALVKGKLPPVILEVRNREAYYSALEKGNAGDDGPFARFVARQLLDQYSFLATKRT